MKFTILALGKNYDVKHILGIEAKWTASKSTMNVYEGRTAALHERGVWWDTHVILLEEHVWYPVYCQCVSLNDRDKFSIFLSTEFLFGRKFHVSSVEKLEILMSIYSFKLISIYLGSCTVSNDYGYIFGERKFLVS